MPAFVPTYIQPTIIIGGQTQAFQYGSSQATSQFQLENTMTATVGSPTQNCLEFINWNTSGFRFRQKSLSTDTIGTLTLETFTSGALPGTVLMTVAPAGTIAFPDNVFILENSLDNTKQLAFSLIGITTETTKTLTVQNASGTIALLSNTLDQFGAPAAPVSWNSQNLTSVNSIQTKIITGNSTTPTIAAGTGAGSSPAVSITGTELSGVVTITAGSSPASNAVIATITLPVALPGTSNGPIISAGNANAIGMAYVVQASTTTFTINSGATALTNTVQYKWNYQILG